MQSNPARRWAAALAAALEKREDDVAGWTFVLIMLFFFLRGPLGISESRVFNAYTSFFGALLYAVAFSAAARLIVFCLKAVAGKIASPPSTHP